MKRGIDARFQIFRPRRLAGLAKHLPATAADERLEPGMVLAVTGYVWEEGLGAVFGREAVLITADGSEVLTASPFWQQ